MDSSFAENSQPGAERQRMDVDIVCVGFGPAMGGFLTTLSQKMMREDGTPIAESRTMPGMPPQVICYERADDISFGVSGVVTRARAIRETFPNLDPAQIPMATPVKSERLIYLLDPHGASRRSRTLRLADWLIRRLKGILPYRDEALTLPYIPPFLAKHNGLLLSLGQFNQWVGSQVMGSGLVQIWPGTPVDSAIIEDKSVVGVRLVDQGTDRQGKPDMGYMPGMEVRAPLTVVGDGPVGAVGQQIDEHFGLPQRHHRREWAVGIKLVVDLPESAKLEPGTVIHTFGYPEPEIFGFLYVYADRIASLGIFVPSWFDNPVRTAYRYLQHWMLHPCLWRDLQGGKLRSFGAKSLQESGRRGEPFLVGDGYARIGEGSGSTNVLTGSGVDEAWATGSLLGEAIIEMLKDGKPFTKENLERSYVSRRRASWVDKESRIAARARDGFSKGVVAGLIGMGLVGLTKGKLAIPGKQVPPSERIPSLEEFYRRRISPLDIEKIRKDCAAKGVPLHDALMDRTGWPAIAFDGNLLVSHQDALLMGGRVQAPAGYRDHVMFLRRQLCENCRTKVCIEMCSGQAITPGPDDGVPAFDREKCVHCGACAWNCAHASPDDPEKGNIRFTAGAGGLHSAEN
ncbi:MAG: 4Fe-4S ferredoxin [bacterium]